MAGNTTNIVTGTNSLTLSWNEKYQLTSAVQDSLFDIRYSYDVLGRKVSRTAGVSPAEVEHYIYNGNQIAADIDENGDLIRTYTWGAGIDNLLAMTVHAATETNTYYALKDHQNSVLAFTDASGTIVESYEYDAWGNVTVFDSSGTETDASNIGNRYLFQGREHDFTTGLTYFRARWYSPETGRWLSKDPIGISGGLNLYAFCFNNPVNRTDPLGQRPFGGGDDGWSLGRDHPLSPIQPGVGLGAALETYGYAMETMSEWHDPLVGVLVPDLGDGKIATGVEIAIDIVVNVPTMPLTYAAAVAVETTVLAVKTVKSVAGLFTSAYNSLTGSGSSQESVTDIYNFLSGNGCN